MGVQNLFKLLESSQQSNLLESLENQRLATDASIWFYQFLKSIPNSNNNNNENFQKIILIKGFLKRLLKLYYHGIKPIFVFDGKPPELKMRVMKMRKERINQHQKDLKKVLEKFVLTKLKREAMLELNQEENKLLNKNKSFQLNLNNNVKDDFQLPQLDNGLKTNMKVEDPRYDFNYEIDNILSLNKDSPILLELESLTKLNQEEHYYALSKLRQKTRQRDVQRLTDMQKKQRDAFGFSKMQIEHLMTRNQVTQKYLDALGIGEERHLPNAKALRVAGAKRRLFELVRQDDAGWKFTGKQSKDKGLGLNKNFKINTEKKIEVDDSNFNNEDLELFNIENDEDDNDDLFNELEDSFDISFDSLKRWGNDELSTFDEKDLILDQNDNFNLIQSTNESLPNQLPTLEIELNTWLNYLKDIQYVNIPSAKQFFELATTKWDLVKLKNQLLEFNQLRESLEKDEIENEELTLETLENVIIYEEFLNEVIKLRQSEIDEKTKKDEINQVDNEDEDEDEELFIEVDDKEFIKDKEEEKENNDLLIEVNEKEFIKDQMTSLIKINKESDNTTSLNFKNEDNFFVEVKNDEFNEKELFKNQDFINKEEKEDKLFIKVNEKNKIKTEDDIEVQIQSNIQGNLLINEKDKEKKGKIELKKVKNHELENYENFNKISNNMETILKDNVDKMEIINLEDVNLNNELLNETNSNSKENFQIQNDLVNLSLPSSSKILEKELESLFLKKQNLQKYSTEVNFEYFDLIQQLLYLMGIPYIVAPSEAEAQCAELLKLGLVDGIISDDVDTLLFGGSPMYRYAFSTKSNYIQKYSLEQIDQSIGLNRMNLIELALLLGSDYSLGIQGIGPVLALEILAVFTSLEKFKSWFDTFNKGNIDMEVDRLIKEFNINFSMDRSKLKKLLTKLKSIELPNNFPNSKEIEAYLSPLVDASDQPFTWASPNLDYLIIYLELHVQWSKEVSLNNLNPILKKRKTWGANNNEQNKDTLLNWLEVNNNNNNTNSKLNSNERNSSLKSDRLKWAMDILKKKR